MDITGHWRLRTAPELAESLKVIVGDAQLPAKSVSNQVSRRDPTSDCLRAHPQVIGDLGDGVERSTC